MPVSRIVKPNALKMHLEERACGLSDTGNEIFMRGKAHYTMHNTSSVKHGGGNVKSASGTGPLVFVDDTTADKSSRTALKVYRAIPSAQVELRFSNLIGQHFTLSQDNYQKHSAKTTEDFFRT